MLLDRSGSVLAVAARSPADERSLLDSAAGVETIELRVADTPVGQLRMRARSQPGPALVRLVTTLVASEVERVRAPARASQEAATAFLRAILSRELADAAEILARADELGIDLICGGTILVARAHAHVPVEEGWRPRVLATAERGARAVVPTAIAAPAEREMTAAEVVVLVPSGDDGDRQARRRGRPARAAGRPAGPHVRDRAQPRRARSAGSAPRGQRGAAGRQRRRGRRGAAAAGVRADRRLPPAAVGDERGSRRAAALLRRDGRAARRLRRAVRDRARPHRRGVPRQRRQRRGHRPEALHPPPHDPLPARARARAVRPRRRLDRRAREAVARPEGDARARRGGARRTGDRARHGRRLACPKR